MEQIDVLINNGTILTVDRERRIVTDGSIAIRRDRIVEVGKTRELATKYRAPRVIDATEKLVMPGLINGHAHLVGHQRSLASDTVNTHDFLKYWIYPYYGAVNAEDEYWGSLNVIAEKIKTGTTCFVEPGCKFLDSTLKAIAQSGIRCTIGSWTWDQAGPDAQKCFAELGRMNTREALALVEHNLSTYRHVLDGRVRVYATIEGVGTCSDELTLGAKQLADKYGAFVVQHKASSVQEVQVELSKTGRRPVEHMYRIGALGPNVYLNHMTAIDDGEVDMLAEMGVKVCHNPSASLKLAKGTTRMGKFLDMMKRGVTVCLGCDGSNSSDYRDMVRAMYLAAALPKDYTMDAASMTAERAIEMATIEGARAIGWEKEIGSLETGKKADLIMFDMNRPEWTPTYNWVTALVYSATGDSVDTVLVDGQVLMEGRRLLTIEERMVRQEMQGRRADFLRRAGLQVPHRWPIV